MLFVAVLLTGVGTSVIFGCERYIVSYGSLYQCWLTFYFHAALQTKSRTVFECWLTLVINVMVCGAGILRLHFLCDPGDMRGLQFKELSLSKIHHIYRLNKLETQVST